MKKIIFAYIIPLSLLLRIRLGPVYNPHFLFIFVFLVKLIHINKLVVIIFTLQVNYLFIILCNLNKTTTSYMLR